MKSDLKELIDQSIQLELNVSKLYVLFSQMFKKDNKFWNKLAEEEAHALLLTKGKDAFISSDLFPSEILASNVNDLIIANHQVEKTIYKFKKEPLSREDTFKTALKLENSAGEIHFHKAMHKSDASEFLKIFQELNENDREHAKRIMDYSKK